ncbi:MAG: YicC family protein [Candidatus Hydrogenedentota bacterium]|nr:MAG: YicC family protein [Candidatus Hydrogenedentota bacterium]
MTGFGQGTAAADGISIWAEISSLNHRYLDISLKLSSPLTVFETEVRKLTQSHFERGRVNVLLTSEGNLPEASQVEFNQHLAQQYVDAARAFAVRGDLKDDLSATSMLRLSSLWTPMAPRPEEMAKLWELAKKALTAAIEQLLEMRRTEGANIWNDLSERIQQIDSVAKDIAVRAPVVVDEYRQRLKERIASITSPGVELDEQRLLAEVALFAERADISEELVRIQSHIEQFNALAQQESNVGRRLDFLLQEMFREITTIGSKARDANIAHAVVEVKGLLEKMREQIQNVE